MKDNLGIVSIVLAARRRKTRARLFVDALRGVAVEVTTRELSGDRLEILAVIPGEEYERFLAAVERITAYEFPGSVIETIAPTGPPSLRCIRCRLTIPNKAVAGAMDDVAGSTFNVHRLSYVITCPACDGTMAEIDPVPDRNEELSYEPLH